MKKKVIGFGLAVLFFGSIATSTFGMTTVTVNGEKIAIVDNDKDKTKAKANKSKTKESCDKKSECCSAAKAKSCHDGDDGGKK